MTNLPESIWADEGDDRVEYVRADIVTARIDAESEPQWQDGYNSARDDLDAESAHISAREAKLAEIDAHRRKVIAENERQMNALIESSRRIAALETQLAEAKGKLNEIACWSQDQGLLWWQVKAREALSALEPAAPEGQQCRCDKCNAVIELDVHVPDEIWKRISPKPIDGYKGGGLLCPQCIVGALTRPAEQAATGRWKRDFSVWLESTHGHVSMYQAYHAGRSAALAQKEVKP